MCLVLFSRLFLNHWLVFVKFTKHLLTIKPCIEFALRPETVRVRVVASTALTFLVCNKNDNYLPNEKNTGNNDLQRT